MAGAVSTPTSRIVTAAAATVSVKDTLGRVLEVRRPGALDRLRLFKALGPGLSSNEQYVGYSMLAMCVVSVDGVPVPQPGNEAQMEGLIGRLGDAGIVAVGQGLLDQAGGGVADAGGGNGDSAAGLSGPAALLAFTQCGDIRDGLFLVKNGVPFDVAFSLDADERRAWVVVIGELEGLVWDYGAGRWT